MFTEWIRTEGSLAKMRADFLRQRLSNAARDQFRRGYDSGYEAGRIDEAAGLPNPTVRYSGGNHPQVEVDGIEVDEGMQRLLKAMWDLGLVTQYSCQGDVDKFSPRAWYSRDYAAQIVFADIDQAYKFLRKTIELLGNENWQEGGLVLSTMLPIDGGPVRADVTFSPRLLPEVTDVWVSFEKTVPAPEPAA